MVMAGTRPMPYDMGLEGSKKIVVRRKPLVNFMLMDGGVSAGVKSIPAFGEPEQFITVFNSSPNTIYVCPNGVDSIDTFNTIDIVFPYMIRTIPIFDLGNIINLVWAGPGGSTARVMVISSVENLGFNVSTTQTSFSIGSNQFLATVESGVGVGSLWGAKNVGTSATKLSVGANSLVKRISLVVQVLGTTDVFVGLSSAVTAANGIKIPAGGEREFRINPRNPVDLYGISSAACDARLLEVLP